jgi:hypothetical protein
MIVTLLSSYSCEMYLRICFSVILMISYEYINTYLKKVIIYSDSTWKFSNILYFESVWLAIVS